jgi:hypothetical protein
LSIHKPVLARKDLLQFLLYFKAYLLQPAQNSSILPLGWSLFGLDLKITLSLLLMANSRETSNAAKNIEKQKGFGFRCPYL